MKNYHNSLNLSEQKAETRNVKCKTQEYLIAEFLKTKSSNYTFTSSELFLENFEKNFIPDNPPLTSVRRAITNLYNLGVLSKVEGAMRKGIYGHKNYVWRVK